MKVKDINDVVMDANRYLMQDDVEDTYMYHDVKTYFDDNDDYVPLANSIGADCLDEYIDFVTEAVFPVDGSWLGHSKEYDANVDTRKRIAEAKQIFLKHLNNADFYDKVKHMLRQGALYCKGYLEPKWSVSLWFDSLEASEIYCSRHSEPRLQRAYSEIWLSKEEVMYTFERVDGGELFTNEGDSDHLETVRIVCCIIPIISKFFDETSKTYTHKKVYYLQDTDPLGTHEIVEVVRKGDSDESTLFKSFPVYMYTMKDKGKRSMAYRALTPAVRANSYEEKIDYQANKALDPPTFMTKNAIKLGQFDLGPNGMVVGDTQADIPTVVESKLNMQLTMQDVMRQENKVRKIFKNDLIDRVNITNVSQYEAMANKYNAIRAVAPSIGPLLTKLPSILLKRISNLLMQHDKEYMLLVKDMDGDFNLDGFIHNCVKIQKAVALARSVQGVAPMLEAFPERKGRIDADKFIISMFGAHNVPEVLATDEEVDAQDEQMAAQQDQEMAQQQQLADAQTVQAEAKGA